MQYPDSPEGVAFGLTLLILGALDPMQPPRQVSEDEALRIYWRCLKAVQGSNGDPPCEVLRLRH